MNEDLTFSRGVMHLIHRLHPQFLKLKLEKDAAYT